MQKRKHGGRETRHPRSKRRGREWDNEQNHTPRDRVLTASGRFEKDRDITIDERNRGATLLRSNRLLQDENVQKWLEQTIKETNTDRRHKASQHVDSSFLSREVESVKLSRAREHDSSTEHPKVRVRSGKRKLDLSSDSSFLEHALASNFRLENLKKNAVENLEMKENLGTSHRFSKRERSVGSQGSVVSLSIKARDDSFDKRRRYKTKLDRYEPKMALVDPMSRVDKGDKKAKVRGSQSRRKMQKSTASHLMHQFSSEKVGLDRLTMRPRLTAGLFKNGRASSPMRRRGLPDLAFSEMNFLRHPKQRSAEIEHKISFSKSREKDRRRSERAQNEISQYFKPCTELYNEVDRNYAENARKISEPGCKSHQDGAEINRNQSRSLKSFEGSVGSSTKPYLNQDHRQVSERLAVGPHLQRQPVQSSVASDKTVVETHREGSYYTWSNSGNSPRASQRNQEADSAASTTPEQVRIMMNDTGIFKGTGINRTTGRMHDTVRKRHSTSKILTNIPNLPNSRNSDPSTIHTRKASYTKTQNQAHIEKCEGINMNQPSPPVLKPGSLDGNSNTSRDEDIQYTAKSITQHTSQNLRAREYNGAKDSVSQAERPQTSLSRHEIAQKAYITHSATTSIAVTAIESLERTPISGKTPKQVTSISHIKPTKQMASGELDADPIQLLDVGPNKTHEGHCINSADKANGTESSTTSQALQHQPLEALSTSGTCADLQDQTTQLADGQRVPYCTPEVMNIIASTYPDTESSINHAALSNIRQETPKLLLPRPIYEGLPLRGSWPDQVRRPTSSHLDINLSGHAGPLYSRQAHNDVPYGLGDRSYGHSIVQRQRFDSCGTLFNIQNDGSDNQDTLGNDYDLFSDTENMQESHIVISNDEECMAPESLQEKEPSLRADHDFLPLAARREHGFYRYPYAANSSNQRRLSVPGSNFSWDRSHLHSSHNLAQSLTETGDLVGSYELRRFWQPQHQY